MDEFKKGLSSLFGKAEDKVLGAKINSILSSNNPNAINDICQTITSMDKNLVLNKLSEYDKNKLENMNINTNELKAKLSQIDSNKVSELLGENGKEIINKINDMLKDI